MKKIAPYKYAPPRRGYSVSLLDTIVKLLWQHSSTGSWPERTFGELVAGAEKILKRELHDASIRGIVYRRMDIFERVNEPTKGAPLKWRLTKKAKQDAIKKILK